MVVLCPHCQHQMTLPEGAQGRFTPRCLKCQHKFELRVERGQASATKVPQTAEIAATVGAAPSAGRSEPAATEFRGSPVTRPQSVDPTNAHHGSGTRAMEEASSRGDPQSSGDFNGQQLGGYRILRELGRGAMGEVYLARQLALDRDVALKTIQARYAKDPSFIARFTREAYAAAQLSHHNIVQVYDLGADRGIHYFSMEFVRGRTLAQVLREGGKLDTEVAVGLALQACRGLAFAHEHGMVHRDVKPDNLLVSECGVLKVADLGLVKVPGLRDEDATSPRRGSSAATALSQAASASATLPNETMGTPLYMAPEQADNAAGVDHRADIYSLGCTLYVMLTGRPPFQGTSAVEVMEKHKHEQMLRPEAIAKHVPRELADINMKMVAREPQERYQSLDEVITDLEQYLGVPHAASASPQETEVAKLEQAANRYTLAPTAKCRRNLMWALAGGCVFGAGLSLLLGSISGFVGTIVFGLSAAASAMMVRGCLSHSPEIVRLRAVAWQSNWLSWLVWSLAGLFALGLVAIAGGVLTVSMCLVLGTLVGGVGAGIIQQWLRQEREAPLASIDELMRGMRIKGWDEAEIRRFIAKYSGRDWEELFEDLFGFDEKLVTRAQLVNREMSVLRRRFGAWREPLVRWLDQRLQATREARERQHFRIVEENCLQAEGMDLLQARRKALAAAEAMVTSAAEMREAARQAALTSRSDPAAKAQKRALVKQMLADARVKESTGVRLKRAAVTAAWTPVALLLGPQLRIVLGLLLLTGCVLWLNQNGVFAGSSLLDAERTVEHVQQSSGGYQPLVLRYSPGFATAAVSSLGAGVGGLIWLISGLFRGEKMGMFALPAGLIAWLGGSVLPGIGAVASQEIVAITAGLALAVAGLVFGRTESW